MVRSHPIWADAPIVRIRDARTKLQQRRDRPRPFTFELLEPRFACDASNQFVEIAPSELTVSAYANTITAALPTTNLVNTPGFESGLGNWTSTSGTGLTRTSSQAHSGSYSARIGNRTQDWHGARQTLQGTFVNGDQLAVAVWVKVENAASGHFDIMIRQTDSAGVQFHYVTRDDATNTTWRELRGTFNLRVTGTLTSLELWVVGPAPGVDFLVDDVTVGRFDWRAAADVRIDQLRKSDGTIRLVDQYGNPLQGATIEIHQTSKDYAFGSAINGNVLTNQAYADFAKEAFNWATLEFESTWASNEFTRGVENYYFADQIIAWAQSNGIQLRGHHLFWGQEAAPPWVDAVPNAELQAEIEDRIVNALTHYAGDFQHWDVVNESLKGTYYSDRLGDWIEPWIYQRAEQVDPNVQLFVNEYQIFEGYVTDDYVKHIQWMQSQGATIDGVGVQAHLPGVVEPFTILSRLDELSSLGLPIWITEFDVASPNENIRADQLEMFYRLAYSHPDVDGILLWDFWAGSASRDPNRALMDVDGTINAAGLRLLSLMNEWSTNIAATAATSGSLSFRGFHGDYEVAITLADGTRSVRQISLDAAHPSQTFTFSFATYPSVVVAAATADDVGLGETFSLQLTASNYAGAAQTGTFTFYIDWNNDGVFDQSTTGSRNIAINHAFNALGSNTFRVQVRDSRGAVSGVIQQSVAVTGFQLANDATNPALKNLVWSGTFGADTVVFTELKPGVIQADIFKLDGVLKGVSRGFEGVTGRIVTTGLGGADQITTRGFNLAPTGEVKFAEVQSTVQGQRQFTQGQISNLLLEVTTPIAARPTDSFRSADRSIGADARELGERCLVDRLTWTCSEWCSLQDEEFSRSRDRRPAATMPSNQQAIDALLSIQMRDADSTWDAWLETEMRDDGF